MPMQLRAVAIAAGVLVVAVVAFVLLSGRGSDIPIINTVLKPKTCPLSGREPDNEKLLDRPAVAVKVENNPAAYPLSGLEKAEIVYEEPVEGGLTRFMAMYHCTDAAKVGPVRSSRTVDPAIMTPTTRILAAAGGNAIVRKALDKGNVVLIDEGGSNGALRRVARPGISSEHTLYGDTVKLRRVGSKRFDRPPSRESYEFGDLDGKSKKASTVTITFSGALTVTYEWKHGRWFRSDDGEPLVAESGKQVAVDNVLIEEHDVNFSKTIVDVAGNPSVEIADVTGRGRAVLFRNGRAIRGHWIRDSVKDPVHFETTDGDAMALHVGTTWVELVPSPRGELKGSFSFAR